MAKARTIDRTVLRDLYVRGFPVYDIAKMMNANPGSIRSLASVEKLNNYRHACRPISFSLSAYERAILKQAAEDRGLNCPELVHKIMCVIIRDDMFNAVLDDGGK